MSKHRLALNLWMALAFLVPLTSQAHQGATGAVKIRMDLMDDVGKATETLGIMAKSGQVDADTARKASTALVKHAAQMPVVFKAQVLDHPTEARAEIWSNWSDFIVKTQAMGRAAGAVARAADDPVAFRSAFGQLARSCTSCHEAYRLKKH